MKEIVLTLMITLAALGSTLAQTCRTDTIVATTPVSHFTDQGDGTVIDEVTGLMWKVCSEGQSFNVATGGCDGLASTDTWKEALAEALTANVIGFAGWNDWRLPNQNELSSIIERQCGDPAINLEVFPATPSIKFWSASPNTNLPSIAWFVDFNEGFGDGSFVGDAFGVRLVRGGR